jgi:hypothetical protein
MNAAGAFFRVAVAVEHKIVEPVRLVGSLV